MGDKRYGSDAFDEDAEILVPAAAGTDSITLTSKEPHLATISNRCFMAFPTSSALRTSGKNSPNSATPASFHLPENGRIWVPYTSLWCILRDLHI